MLHRPHSTVRNYAKVQKHVDGTQAEVRLERRRCIHSPLLTQVFRSDWCERVAGSPDIWRQDNQSPAACLCIGSGDAWTYSEPCGRGDWKCIVQNEDMGQDGISFKRRNSQPSIKIESWDRNHKNWEEHVAYSVLVCKLNFFPFIMD